MPETAVNIKKLIIDSNKEIVHKIVREILLLFGIAVGPDSNGGRSYDTVIISNDAENTGRLQVTTAICMISGGVPVKKIQKISAANPDENPRAAVNRLIKWNLYCLLSEEIGPVSAPWGILHGVRPAKIVHRYIENGMDRDDIIRRLMNDYGVSRAKADLLTGIARGQLPVISSSDRQTVSIYIGIPFCLSRCLYCSFPSNILPESDILDSFMTALHKEILALKNLIKKYGLKVQTIYIGGGTPTSLPESRFALLLQYADILKTAGTAEFTVEAGRPDSITAEKIRLMNEHAVSRISVNPQTMQEKTLTLIGRKHTARDIVDTYKLIRSMSSARINMDLILGLPGESAAEAEDTIRKVVGLDPDDITVHALAIKKGSNLKLHQSAVDLPGDAAVREMACIVAKILAEHDYSPYYLYRQGYMSGQLENTGYCHKGAAGVYNIQIMSERQTILGVGGNASTKIVAPSGAYLKTLFNPKDLKTYLDSVDEYIARRISLMEEVYGK